MSKSISSGERGGVGANPVEACFLINMHLIVELVFKLKQNFASLAFLFFVNCATTWEKTPRLARRSISLWNKHLKDYNISGSIMKKS